MAENRDEFEDQDSDPSGEAEAGSQEQAPELDFSFGEDPAAPEESDSFDHAGSESEGRQQTGDGPIDDEQVDDGLSIDDWMSGFGDESPDYSLDELSQAYAQILADQDGAGDGPEAGESGRGEDGLGGGGPGQSGTGHQGNAPFGSTADGAQGQAQGKLGPGNQGQGAGPVGQEASGAGGQSGDGTGTASEGSSQFPGSGKTSEGSLEGQAEQQAIAFLRPVQTVDRNEDLQQDDRVTLTPERIVESILFVGTPDNSAVSGRLIASLIRGVSPKEVDQYVAKLNEQYRQDQCPYRIAKEPLGYRMVLREAFQGIRSRFYGQVREVKLSQVVIDTLAVVAFHQPISREEVEKLMGRPSGGNLNQLIRRNLLSLEVKSKTEKLYHTTERFLDFFGMESLEDLPQMEMDTE